MHPAPASNRDIWRLPPYRTAPADADGAASPARLDRACRRRRPAGTVHSVRNSTQCHARRSAPGCATSHERGPSRRDVPGTALSVTHNATMTSATKKCPHRSSSVAPTDRATDRQRRTKILGGCSLLSPPLPPMPFGKIRLDLRNAARGRKSRTDHQTSGELWRLRFAQRLRFYRSANVLSAINLLS